MTSKKKMSASQDIYLENFIEKYKDNIDWESISKNPNLNHYFIEKYKEKLDWNILSEYFQNFTLEIVKIYEKKINFDLLKLNKYLPLEINDNCDIDIDAIYSSPKLTEEFIENELEDQSLLLRNPAFSLNLIEKYQNTFDFSEFSLNPNLSSELIEKYQDDLYWNLLSTNPALNCDLIIKYHDLIDIEMLSQNPNLTPDLIEKYFDNFDLLELLKNPAFTIDLIENTEFNGVEWDSLSENPNLTEEFIEKYKEKLNWSILCSNKCLKMNNNIPIIIESNDIENDIYKDNIDEIINSIKNDNDF